MKYAIGLFLLVAAAVAVMYLLGRRLPREHTASRSARVPASPAAVFAAITDK